MCLISKYGFSNQFEKCLEIILKMSLDEKISIDDINKLLIHLIYEIPAPQINKKIFFYVPYRTNPIEIPQTTEENRLANYNLKTILDFFSIENIINIFNLIIMEQKIIFVADEYRLISEISQAFIHLIYPLNWINSYVPVLSEEMLKYLQSFMPFIMGVDISLLNKAKSFIEDDLVYIININKNFIDISNNKKSKKNDRKSLCKNLPEIPPEIKEELLLELKPLKKICEEKKSNLNINKFDKLLKETFIKAIVMMIGDYKKFVSYIDNIPLFNTDCFLNNRSPKYKTFYTELSQSQIFRHFLHSDNINPLTLFEKACFRYSNNINKEKRSSSKTGLRKYSTDKTANLINNISNNTTTVSLTPNLQVKRNSFYSNNDSGSKVALDSCECIINFHTFNLYQSMYFKFFILNFSER